MSPCSSTNLAAARTASCSTGRHRRREVEPPAPRPSAIAGLVARRRRGPRRRRGRPGSRRCDRSSGGARRSSRRPRRASGSGPSRRSRGGRCRGAAGAQGTAAAAGMRASVSVSSGPMWTNCDDVQQAVQPSHGTADATFRQRGLGASRPARRRSSPRAAAGPADQSRRRRPSLLHADQKATRDLRRLSAAKYLVREGVGRASAYRPDFSLHAGFGVDGPQVAPWRPRAGRRAHRWRLVRDDGAVPARFPVGRSWAGGRFSARHSAIYWSSASGSVVTEPVDGPSLGAATSVCATSR